MFAEMMYTCVPSFCFICPFCLCSSSIKTGTSFGQHQKMSKRMGLFCSVDKARSMITESVLVSSDLYFVVWTAGAWHTESRLPFDSL